MQHCCLSIDIDFLKRSNDAYGHSPDDRALPAIASCIRKAVRLGDTVARDGGEESGALVHGMAADAWTTAERLRLAVESLDMQDNGETVPLTESIGVAACARTSGSPDGAIAAQALPDSADRAMYRARRIGRSRVKSDPGVPGSAQSPDAAADQQASLKHA
ncbi:GGDEF domain-containing protein [Paraburkholderia sp. RL18-103-BIB-C]|uniref:GGDEF domain-containing protein n=1 Tax=Paraburkholderia sp. RL18-103-BIB-C TaxID=3031637 RepID=UPI0038BAF83C